MRFAEGSRRWTDGGRAGSLKAPEDRPAAVVQNLVNLQPAITDACIRYMKYPVSSANQILHENTTSETRNPVRDATRPGQWSLLRILRSCKQCGLRMKRAMIIANGKPSYIYLYRWIFSVSSEERSCQHNIW